MVNYIKKIIKKRKIFLSNKDGYAILFAVVIVSIISMISIGLANTTYKQFILSSLANDSHMAFYQADTAVECGLYAENVLNISSSLPPTWTCGKDVNGSSNTFTISPTVRGIIVTPDLTGQSIPCFSFKIEKVGLKTEVIGNGHNTCNFSSPRSLERSLFVTY